jgi:hypothetical protein
VANDSPWILIVAIVVLALVGFAIVWNIDRLNRVERRQMREAEQGSTRKGHSTGI